MSALGNASGFVGMEELEARECFSAPHKVSAPPPKVAKKPAVVVPAKAAPRTAVPATTFQAPPGGPHALLDYSTTYTLAPQPTFIDGVLKPATAPPTMVRVTMLLGHDAKKGGLTGEILVYINNKLVNTGNVHFSGTDGSMSYQTIFSGQSINITAFASPDWSSMSGGFSDVFSTATVPPIEIPFGIPRVLLVG